MRRLLRTPNNITRVWVDIGTADRSDFEHNSAAAQDVFVLGVEPTPAYYEAMLNRTQRALWGARWLMVQRACVGLNDTAEEMTLLVHPLQECNSLLASPDGLNVHGKACVGTEPTRRKVRTTTLQPLLRRVLALANVERVELLKVDVQGYEWPCVEGAGSALPFVDNLFLEAQDLPRHHPRMMYKGARNIGELDAALAPHGFVRQYCEDNMTPGMRELNCLWTQRGRKPLWVTGRPQGPHPSVAYNTKVPPVWHRQVAYVDQLMTASSPGALFPLLHGRTAGRLHGWSAWLREDQTRVLYVASVGLALGCTAQLYMLRRLFAYAR